MIDISGLPNVDPATANLINGEMVDVTTPGDGTGTPVRKDLVEPMYYALIAIMNEAGITADDSAEGATSSQVKDAILRVARKQVQGPSYSNLLVKRNAGTPNSKIDVTFDKLWIEGIEKTSGSYTIDITASGVLGLDTGAEAPSTWYYLWVIAKADGTVSALLSASATSPTLPAGYVYKRLVSMVYNSSGSNFTDFVQSGEHYKYVVARQFASGAAAMISETDLDASQYIPLLVSETYIHGSMADSNAGTTTSITVYAGGSLNGSFPIMDLQAYANSGIGISARANINGILRTDNRHIGYRAQNISGGGLGTAYDFRIFGFKVPL